MLKRLWRAETGIFLGVWLTLMIGGRSKLLRDPGTFWHTVVGRLILSRREFLDTDPFSFTFGGRPWVPYEWLGECVMAVLHDHLAGLDTLLLATVSLLAGVYTWVGHRLIRAGLGGLPAFALVLFVMAASSSHFHVRPHLVTIAFLGITFALLCDFEAGRVGLGRLAWLVPLFVVWANVHGGMLGGLGTLGLAVAGWTVYKVVGLPSPVTDSRRFLLLGLLVLVCGLAMLVNPYGIRLPETWYQIMREPLLPQLIIEHAPLNPFSLEGATALGFGVFYLFVLAGTWPKRPRVTWLLPLVWLVLACMRIRHAPLFALTASVALADLLPQTRWAAWLDKHRRHLFHFPEADARPGFPWTAALLPAALVLVTFVLQTAGVRVPVLGRGWAQLDPTHWPVELLPELQKLEQPGTHIFNEYQYGGFLIYHTPNLRVFIDDRCEVYGGPRLKEFVDAANQNPERIDEWSRDPKDGFDYALVQTGGGFDVYLRRPDSGWVVMRRTDTATLYQKAKPSDADGGK